jgi:Putative Flp pilus-assembly TadE/G-like
VARLLSKFGRDRGGGVALVFGLALPVLLAAVAAAVEYGLLVHRRDQLQNAADMGAIAAARELSLAALGTDGTAGLARTIILASLSKTAGVSVDAQVHGASVEVTVRDTVKHYFGAVLGASSSQLEARAVARIASSRLCLLALEPGKRGAIDMNKSARLTALQCSVFSNSKDRAGIVAADSARMDAENVCSAGGIDGKENFVRPPTTDCPQISDPLAARTPPAVGACTFSKTVIKGGTHSLQPGVYCDGLKITDGATVTLSPGTYIIQGGKFTVDKGALLEGEDVGFFLAGKHSTLEFGYDTTISLAAPRTGEMAGILIFDDRGEKSDKHRIYSNNARKLLGTVYMPNGALYIDAKRPIADRSAYTVVIARTVEIFDGPDLVLNSDYTATSVPVPKGVGPVGSTVSLVK